MPSASKTLASSLLALRVCSWPAVAAGRAADAPAPVQEVEFQVPKGFAMSARRASRPGGGVAAFLVPQLWCAADARREVAGSIRVGSFDAQGRLLWDAKAAGTLEIQEMAVQQDGAVIVRGWHLEKSEGAERSSVLFRFDRGGFDRTFHVLTPADLGNSRLTSVRLASDDSIEIEGSFSSVRGKPRSGRARLRADGTLED